MPGPVSDSYDGPDDEKPAIPQWARPLTAEEAAQAWRDAPEVPVSEDRIKEIVAYAKRDDRPEHASCSICRRTIEPGQPAACTLCYADVENRTPLEDAAPDLLAACEALLAAGHPDGRYLAICQQDDWRRARELAEAAIAKSRAK